MCSWIGRVLIQLVLGMEMGCGRCACVSITLMMSFQLQKRIFWCQPHHPLLGRQAVAPKNPRRGPAKARARPRLNFLALPWQNLLSPSFGGSPPRHNFQLPTQGPGRSRKIHRALRMIAKYQPTKAQHRNRKMPPISTTSEQWTIWCLFTPHKTKPPYLHLHIARDYYHTNSQNTTVDPITPAHANPQNHTNLSVQ